MNPDKMVALNQAVTTQMIVEADSSERKRQLVITFMLIMETGRFHAAFREFNDMTVAAFMYHLKDSYPDTYVEVEKLCSEHKFLLQIENDAAASSHHYPKLSNGFWKAQDWIWMIAQVTTALDAGQRAAEDELALNMAGWDR